MPPPMIVSDIPKATIAKVNVGHSIHTLGLYISEQYRCKPRPAPEDHPTNHIWLQWSRILGRAHHVLGR